MWPIAIAQFARRSTTHGRCSQPRSSGCCGSRDLPGQLWARGGRACRGRIARLALGAGLQVAAAPHPDGRYELHDLVRQYALEHSIQEDEQEPYQTANRHCQYYALLLERRGATFKGPEQPAVVAELMAELANVRLGWEWAATHAFADELNQAADTLFWLYESQSNCREGVPLFGQAVHSLQIDDADAQRLVEQCGTERSWHSARC